MGSMALDECAAIAGLALLAPDYRDNNPKNWFLYHSIQFKCLLISEKTRGFEQTFYRFKMSQRRLFLDLNFSDP